MVRRPAFVLKVCPEIPRHLPAAMATSVKWMRIVHRARLAWASVATILVPALAGMVPTVA